MSVASNSAISLQKLCISCITRNISYFDKELGESHLEFKYIVSPFYALPNSLKQEIIDSLADEKKLTPYNLLLFLSGTLSRYNSDLSLSYWNMEIFSFFICRMAIG